MTIDENRRTGTPGSVFISGDEHQGFFLSSGSLGNSRAIADGVFRETSNMNSAQRSAMVDLFEKTGLAESTFSTTRGVFSLKRQMGGTAMGFLQVEPRTAIDVLDRTVRLPESHAMRQRVDRGTMAIFGVDLPTLAKSIGEEPDLLDDVRVQALVMRLVYGMHGFRDIDGFSEMEEGGEHGLNDDQFAKIWKKRWNTPSGKGTVEGFMTKQKLREMLR